ncbi:cytochrome P450 [Lipomyces kononenkoae]|uniref:Cytochrome P450 n=1 Tax=Lipomyces kononenkoae TaxID=34357 RepID=A0ACC3SSU8_LIPKO
MGVLVRPPVACLVAAATSPLTIVIVTLILLCCAVVQKLESKRIEGHFAAKSGAVRLSIKNKGVFGLRRFLSLSRSLREHRIVEYMARDFEKFGNTFSTKVFGQLSHWTIEPENIKAILATKFHDFGLGTRYDAFLPFLGEGIFTLDNQGWAHSRAMLRPQFRRQQVSDVAMLEPHVRNLMSCLAPGRTESCDIQELFYRMTLDSATEFLFGESVQSLRRTPESRNHERDNIFVDVSEAGKRSFTDAFNYCQEVLAIRAILRSFCWLHNPKDFHNTAAVAHNFVDYYVNKALEAYHCGPAKVEEMTAGRYVFLYSLVQETQDPRVLRDQLLNILLAGRDTTAALLSWTLYLLASHPRVFEKLRREIIEKFGDNANSEGKEKISFESLKSTLYLRYVLSEVLRLYPPVPLNYRCAVQDTVLPVGGGLDGKLPVLVRKGDTVAYSVYVMHRRKDLYGEDADEFRPERWSEGKSWSWEYLPFNGGQRICLGQQYALTEAGYTIVRLLQEFDTLESTEPPEPECFPLKRALLTMSKATGVHVKIYRK